MTDPTDWNADALAMLAENAEKFASTWVAVRDALVKEGVTQSDAAHEARTAATLVAVMANPQTGDCPLCGGSGTAP